MAGQAWQNVWIFFSNVLYVYINNKCVFYCYVILNNILIKVLRSVFISEDTFRVFSTSIFELNEC